MTMQKIREYRKNVMVRVVIAENDRMSVKMTQSKYQCYYAIRFTCEEPAMSDYSEASEWVNEAAAEIEDLVQCPILANTVR